MLLFRDEEHVRRWCHQWRLPVGAILTVDTAWRLAQAWFGADRGDPAWARPTPTEVEALFASLGLTDDFWKIR
jgi:hypothetical protein